MSATLLALGALKRQSFLGATFAAVLVGIAVPPAVAEEQTVAAFSVWQVEGALVQTGETQASFTGIFAGPVYVETERGPVLAGAISCPATVEIELDSGRQSATARCAFQAGDESRLYGTLTCKGVHLVGCDGDFQIAGGSGRFAGARGEGPVTVRADFRRVAMTPEGAPEHSAAGIIYWPSLRYTLP
ncbi:hypothetical protein [Pelagibius sp. 7325]|uniref:hypothetical protein n=1 Tax=Pelagibius sp. 7325 TaxID=3131994 RepID=UPI0030EC079D